MRHIVHLAPVLMLSTMLLIALVIETYLAGLPHLLPKVPLLALLIWPWIRSDREARPAVESSDASAVGDGP